MIVDLNTIYASKKLAEGFGDEEFRAGLGMIVDSTMNNAAYVDEGPMIAAAGAQGSMDGSTQDFLLAVSKKGGSFNV